MCFKNHESFFMKKNDVTVDITRWACYTSRCNSKSFNKKDLEAK